MSGPMPRDAKPEDEMRELAKTIRRALLLVVRYLEDRYALESASRRD